MIANNHVVMGESVIMGSTVKKQHYIWRKYLSKWTETGDQLKGKLFVLRKTLKGNQNKIEFRELEKIGFEKYYYDITGFKETDVSILNQLITYTQRKELAKFGIAEEALNDAATQRDFIEKNVICNSENIETKFRFFEKLLEGDLSFYEDSKNQCILDALMDTILASICYGEELPEKQLIDLVKEFSLEETVDLKYEFNRFFCMQYFRSPRIHTNTKKNIEELKQNHEEIKDMNLNFFTNMVMVYFAERMALNITQNFKSSILLYKNNTEVSFVTGDTPIICLTGDKMNDMSIFHYPISPKIAVELIVTPKFSDFTTVSKNIVMEINQELVGVVKNCNRKLADNCVNEIYSNTEKSLSDL